MKLEALFGVDHGLHPQLRVQALPFEHPIEVTLKDLLHALFSCVASVLCKSNGNKLSQGSFLSRMSCGHMSAH